MFVKVKKLNEKAEIPFKTYDEDFCYDCIATSCEEIAPNVYKYGLGLAFEIMRTCDEPMIIKEAGCHSGVDLLNSYLLFDIDFRPRSSVWKTGMVLSNCTGTVDELYRGEVSAVFYHVMPNMPKYEVGDKIIQCKLGVTLPMRFFEATELSETVRGSGGYGSTGK